MSKSIMHKIILTLLFIISGMRFFQLDFGFLSVTFYNNLLLLVLALQFILILTECKNIRKLQTIKSSQILVLVFFLLVYLGGVIINGFSESGFSYVVGVLIIFILWIQNHDFLILKKAELFTYVVVFFTMIVQIFLYRFPDGRPILSIGDPNYSGALVFIFFGWSFYTKRLSGVVFSIIALFLFQSRAFILGIGLFILMWIIDYLTKKNKFQRFNNFMVSFNLFHISLIGFLLTVFISYGYFFVFPNISEVEYRLGIDRVLLLNDESNNLRFAVNIITFDKIISEIHVFLWGLRGFTNSFFADSRYGILPHNGYLRIVIQYGFLFFISFTLVISRFFSKEIMKTFFPIFIGSLAFSLFLSDFFFNPLFLIFLYLLIHVIYSNYTNFKVRAVI